MDRALLVRVTALYAPAMLAALAWVLRPPARRQATGALLAAAWCLPALLLANVVAVRIGWWAFAPTPASLLGVPVDLLLGWMLLWGVVPVAALRALPLAGVVALLVVADLVLMPLAAPVVTLGTRWLAGEALAVVVALVPAQLAARWTAENRRVAWRAAAQAVAFGALVLWVLPSTIFAHAPGGGSWDALLTGWRRVGGLPLQLLAVPVVVGLSAVQEFARRGGGTPVPFDPPVRLVTSGPYAYVANPMQLAAAVLLTGWGLLLRSPWLVLAGPMVVAYGVGLAEPDERADLDARFGDAWRAYRRRVGAWRPRWRPYHASESDAAVAPARLYLSAGCGKCSEIARWLLARDPRGLVIVPAEQHPSRDLVRATYDPGDGGAEESGVAAIARALEHLTLGWALLGWTARLPLIRPTLQLLVDASGGEARRVTRCARPTEVTA